MTVFPIQRFDHLEFYVGNARQAASFYTNYFGFSLTAYQGLETGSRDRVSYVLEQGEIRFVLSAALCPDHPIAQSVLTHSDTVAVVALEVSDAIAAYKETIARGAISAIEPTELEDATGIYRYAAIQAYGDVLIKFVDRADYRGIFAPGYEQQKSKKRNPIHVNLHRIDHVVGNVEFGTMNQWATYFLETMGFELLIHFDDETISTEDSALMSKVMHDQRSKIKFPINEPAIGKRKSQIQEYLEYHCGAGIQHIACTTPDIIDSVSKLKSAGVEFIHVPKTYYENLEARIGQIDKSIEQLAELGILVDRDRDGYLLQIFTQPVQDRPTLFFEIIERHGAQGFGEGNFKSLFEAIEREQALRGNL